MEMEFKDNTRRRRVAFVVGLVLAVVAGGAALAMTGQPTATADPLPTRRVLVAAVAIPPRTMLDASDLAEREVPADATNAAAISDPRMVVGLTSSIAILPGQALTPNLFTAADPTRAFAIIQPGESFGPDSPQWRAASVEVDQRSAVGGLVTPGQRIDLIASMYINVVSDATDPEAAPRPGPVGGMSAKVVLTDLEVLAVVPESSMYVLKVDAHQAEEIAFLQNQNPSFRGFSLMLRPDGDTRVLPRDGYGTTGDRILLKYAFPLEQAIIGDRYPQPSAEPVVLDPTPPPATPRAPAASAAPEASPGAAAAPTAGVAPAASPSPDGSPAAG